MRFIVSVLLIGIIAGCGGGSGDSASGGSASSGSGSGGGTSAPTITSLAPTSAIAGGGAFTLTVNGTNFVAGSMVDWNGAMLTTTYVNATQLTASVPATDIATSGTAAVTVANGASAGGTSTGQTFTISAGTSGGPSLAQWNSFNTPGNTQTGNTSVSFTKATKAGDTIWVAVTLSDYAGIHTISVNDSQGNTYTPLDQVNDGQPVSTSTTSNTQSVAHFYATNIAGDASTPDTVNVVWTEENYKGVLIAEISGVTGASLVGHDKNQQDGLGQGTNNVTSNPINIGAGQTPALLVALSMNTSGGSSDTGGSGFGGPTAGSGLTQQGQVWDWGTNLATFVTENIATAETVEALFNAPDTDSYVTVAAVFH